LEKKGGSVVRKERVSPPGQGKRGEKKIAALSLKKGETLFRFWGFRRREKKRGKKVKYTHQKGKKWEV